jgi:hypothetical protein
MWDTMTSSLVGPKNTKSKKKWIEIKLRFIKKTEWRDRKKLEEKKTSIMH